MTSRAPKNTTRRICLLAAPESQILDIAGPLAFAALLPLKADMVSNGGDTEKWDSQWLLQAPLTPEQTLWTFWRSLKLVW